MGYYFSYSIYLNYRKLQINNRLVKSIIKNLF